MNISIKIIGAGLLFLFTIAAGIWLSNSGKPLNTLIFTTHKLIALSAVIFTAIVIYKMLKDVEIRTAILILIIAAGLSVLALFISGALLSLDKPVNNTILAIHRITSTLTVLITAVIIYLLVGRKQ
ncbi:MAG: hypothetical protein GXP33_10985 [Spirochaetes bacterium]|nr:hypothetical protein [Spirochaetota bacterium]